MVNSRNCNPQCGKVLTRCKISRCHKLFPFLWFSPTLQPALPPSSMLSFSSSTLLYYISRSFGYRNIDDRHRNPYINIREIIWLGNQLLLKLLWFLEKRKRRWPALSWSRLSSNFVKYFENTVLIIYYPNVFSSISIQHQLTH